MTFENIISGLIVGALWLLHYKGIIGGGKSAPAGGQPSGTPPDAPPSAPALLARIAALIGDGRQVFDALQALHATLSAAQAQPAPAPASTATPTGVTVPVTVHVVPTAAPSAPTATAPEPPKAA